MAAYAHESITVNTAVGLTSTYLSYPHNKNGVPLKEVVCSLEGGAIMITVDGTTPTSSVGHLINPGDVFYLDADEASKFRAIKSGSTNGVLKATYTY